MRYHIADKEKQILANHFIPGGLHKHNAT